MPERGRRGGRTRTAGPAGPECASRRVRVSRERADIITTTTTIIIIIIIMII